MAEEELEKAREKMEKKREEAAQEAKRRLKLVQEKRFRILMMAAEDVPVAQRPGGGVDINAGFAAGQLIAQGDSPPQGNVYPTSIWTAGEQIRDPHQIWIPEGAVPGSYRLAIGFYDLASGQRLPAYDEDGDRWPDDSVPLTDVLITAGP